MRISFIKLVKQNLVEITLVLIALLFSSYLMFFTFYKESGNLFIAGKAWSDFGSHIPLIRSFSFGSNFPPQYPLFPGEPINYHFLFYFFSGVLEKTGLPIDFALNIPSIAGFSLLILIVYIFASKLFHSKAVGILSVIFLIFNSSLSFLYFWQNHKNSSDLFFDLITNNSFSSFAPYGEGLVTAFWNLNIYTNQRHLGLSFALSLLIILLVLKPLISNKKIDLKLSLILGVILGFSFYLHIAVFFMTLVVLFFIFIAFTNLRKSIFFLAIPAFLLSFPQYLYLQSGGEGFGLRFVSGYLTASQSTFDFFKFWIYNLGISVLLIPLGFIKSSINARKILFCFIPLFLIGNFIQFSPEIAANHKFFNYFLLIGNMFSAFFLVYIWKKNLFFKMTSIFLFTLMILGGIVDFFPIFNDQRGALKDYENNKNISWIQENTPKDSVFLNTTYFNNDAALAGRKIFLGWPYFSWSQGYDTEERDKEIKFFFTLSKPDEVCRFLDRKRIDYIYLERQPTDYSYIESFWGKFKPIYENKDNKSKIFEVKSLCLGS